MGDERCVLHKLNGSLFRFSRYKVQLSDAYPVNPVKPSAEPLAADCQNEDTDSKSGFEISENDSNTPTINQRFKRFCKKSAATSR